MHVSACSGAARITDVVIDDVQGPFTGNMNPFKPGHVACAHAAPPHSPSCTHWRLAQDEGFINGRALHHGSVHKALEQPAAHTSRVDLASLPYRQSLCMTTLGDEAAATLAVSQVGMVYSVMPAATAGLHSAACMVTRSGHHVSSDRIMHNATCWAPLTW